MGQNTPSVRIHKDLLYIFWGSYLKFRKQNLRSLSPVPLEAKLGALRHEFERQILESSPCLRSLNMEVPPGKSVMSAKKGSKITEKKTPNGYIFVTTLITLGCD